MVDLGNAAAWAFGAGFAALLLLSSPRESAPTARVAAEAVVGRRRGGGQRDAGQAGGPRLHRRVKAIDAGQYAAAIPLLQKAIARDGTNADAYNWLAYATRRNGDPAASIPIYEKALTIDPKHRGAHEYIGEAYLTLDNLPKAKEHLAQPRQALLLPVLPVQGSEEGRRGVRVERGKIKPTASR